MQKDMHYYGVFTLARAAGLKKEHSKTIATASQFVDDNVIHDLINFSDAARFHTHATGHHAFNVRNLDLDDQREVWVPFHFLPGNEGTSYTERLICRKNSETARKMIDMYLEMHELPFIVELIGIAAHVYADTFSHFGFSGVSSRRNRINQDKLVYDKKLDAGLKTYVEEKIKRFAEKYGDEHAKPNLKSWLFPTVKEIGDLIEKTQGLVREGALGHAGAYTLPDRPYLEWEYCTDYPDEEKIIRDNPRDFIEGCEALYEMFARLGDKRADLQGGDRVDFDSIKGEVETIIKLQASMEGRIDAWHEAVKEGRVCKNKGDTIPNYDNQVWHKEREGLRYMKNSADAVNCQVFRFYQAASFHRTYVLRTLLPEMGLVVH